MLRDLVFITQKLPDERNQKKNILIKIREIYFVIHKKKIY